MTVKKYTILLITLGSSLLLSAQIRPRDRYPNRTGAVVMKENLLDRSPGFKKAPIRFVPLAGDPAKGYDPEKTYSWVNPQTGERHSAKGKEILAMTNDMEKALNERGHSLREKTPFIQLSLQLPVVAKNDLSRCVIKNQVTNKNTRGNSTGNGGTIPAINRLKINNGRIDTRIKTMVDATVYSYVGNIITNAREFRNGTLGSSVQMTRNGSSITADLMLVIPPALMNKAAGCAVALSTTQNGSVVTTAKLNIKSPSATIAPVSGGYSITYEDCIEPQNMPRDYLMRIYTLELGNTGYNFPVAGTQPNYYYATISFYDAAGQLINTYQPNQVVFNNQLPMPINIAVSKQSQYNGFNYELTDPGLHAFGFYASSAGFSSSYSANDFGYNGKDRKASVSADMSIGVKYYNFRQLVNSSEPLSEQFVLFGYKLTSEEKYYRADGVPPIRVPGSGGLKKEAPDYGVVTLLGKDYDLRNTNLTSFEEIINKPVTDIRFFIGPVPCRVSVDITGKVSVAAEYQSSSNCDIRAILNPHADVSLRASGGVDAYSIAYAKVVADVNLLTIDMPYVLTADNTAKSTSIQPTLSVGGLAGQIYFQAGLCIPIPFVDDICTDFRIDILNWKGLEKNITIDAAKGIVL